jgi:DNA-binding MarR family transcriptional regulator
MKKASLTSKPVPRPARRRNGQHRPAFDTSDRVAHLMREAEKLLVRAFQVRLAEHGVAHGHWTFLRILWKHDGISQTELSDLAGVMTPSTFAAVRAMEELGYVVRKQRPGNRKNVYVYLTRAGRALEAKLVPLAVEVNEVAVAGMPKQQVEDLRGSLIAMIKNLESP